MTSERAPGERFYALLIGIDDYAIAPPLRGCTRDVARARAFLDGLGVPADHICTRVNAEASREGIIDAIQRHLIDNDAITDGDQVLLHYSGHGAHMVDPLDRSPSGYIESLVACDSGRGGAYGIPDTTVSALLAQVARRTADITVVFDCCHSGSGTRDPVGARLTRPDERRPPAELDAAIVAAAGVEQSVGRWGRGVPYTLLAACRDRELAVEHIEDVDGEAVHQGLFSWCLYRTLEAAPPGLSYAELMERVGLEVTRRDRFQHPQCEGRRERVVFGGADVRRDAFLRVVRASRSRLVVDGGSIAGVTRDALLTIYPVGTRRRDALPAPLCRARVTTSQPTEADAVVEADPDVPPVEPATLAGCPALVVEAGAPPWVGRVAFEGAAALRSSALWQVAAPGEAPDARVVADARGLTLHHVARDEVVRAYAHRRVATLAADLDTIMRFERLERLVNPDQGSRVQGALRMRVRRHDPHTRDPAQMARVDSEPGEVVLPVEADGDGGDYGIEVVNDSGERIYAHLVLLNADYSVILLSPVSSGEVAIDPGRSAFVGHTAPRERIKALLPDEWGVARDTVLLIATVEPAKLEVLEQAGIDADGQRRGEVRWSETSAFVQAIEAFSRGRRMLRRQTPRDWGTATLPVTVMRRPAPVRVGRWTVELAPGVRAEAGAFSGQVTAAGYARARCLAGAPALPIAAVIAAGFTAVESRARGERDALVLHVEGEGALTVEVDGEGTLAAFAFDAAGCRPAGEGTGGRVTIEPGARWVVLARPA